MIFECWECGKLDYLYYKSSYTSFNMVCKKCLERWWKMKCIFCGTDKDLVALDKPNTFECEFCSRYFEAKEIYEDEI